jgi:hypothetical protein
VATNASQNRLASSLHLHAIHGYYDSGRMFEKHPAAIQFGVPRGKPSMAHQEAMVLFGVLIFSRRHVGNTAKVLEAG